jgi:RNA polymerase sigma-70 factor (ECF subfamily)
MDPQADANEQITRTLELVRKAQGGSKEALNRLFDRYYERVRRSVRVRLGRGLRNRLESGDILQMVFAKAFEKFEHFEMRNEGALLNWLSEIAVGQIHDEADKANASKRKHEGGVLSIHGAEDGEEEAGIQLEGDVTGPLDGVQKRESRSAVDACMDELPEHYREVILLRDYDGMEWKDIAKKLGKNTDSAARELHSRAMLALTRLLQQRGAGPES